MIDDTIETETAGDSMLDDTVIYDEPPTQPSERLRKALDLLIEANKILQVLDGGVDGIDPVYLAKAGSHSATAINYLNLGD